MATEVKIEQLYRGTSKSTQQPIAPKTKVSAISDENNIGLNVLLNEKADSNHSHTPASIGALGLDNTYGLEKGKTYEITDWNSAIYTGVYTAPNPSVANNPPSGDYFVGITYYYSPDYIVQTAYSVTYQGYSWMRKRIAGSWTAWGQIAIAEYNSSTNTLNFIM